MHRSLPVREGRRLRPSLRLVNALPDSDVGHCIISAHFLSWGDGRRYQRHRFHRVSGIRLQFPTNVRVTNWKTLRSRDSCAALRRPWPSMETEIELADASRPADITSTGRYADKCRTPQDRDRTPDNITREVCSSTCRDNLKFTVEALNQLLRSRRARTLSNLDLGEKPSPQRLGGRRLGSVWCLASSLALTTRQVEARTAQGLRHSRFV